MTVPRVLLVLGLSWPLAAFAGGIDQKATYDQSGIWSRTNQRVLEYGSIIVNISLAVVEGGETRLGRNAWQSVDSMALSSAIALVAKPVFGRQRPSENDDPDSWGQGGKSFPSGEVALITGVVTPYILEYHQDNPWVYSLALLPVYDSIARVKAQAHWQTDVLAGMAIGVGSGYLAWKRDSPFFLNLLPDGVKVGYRKKF
jgi:undecaprenyl-diphosphatase